jgi:single-stranded DNA-binding protein
MLNQALIIGPVVKEPKEYGKVVKFAVGGYREYQGQRQDTMTEIVCFGRTSAKANSLRVGMLVAVTGRVESKTRESNKGGSWSSTDFIADDIRPIEAPAASDGYTTTRPTKPLPPSSDWDDGPPF